MAACPECGTEQDTGRFCGHCGATLPASRGPRDGDGPRGRGWEDHDRTPHRPWTVGWLTAVVIGLVAALVASSGGAGEPGPGEAAPDRPVSTSLPSPQQVPVAAPPLPVTTPGDCPDQVPGCTAWHTDFPGAEVVTPPVLGTDPRHAYLVGSLRDRTGALYAIDPGNGIQLWRRRLPGTPRLPLVTPWRTVAVVYDDPRAGSGVREYDPETGEIRWQAEAALSSQVSTPPAAAGSTLAVAGPGRMLLRHLDGNAVTIVEIEGSPTGLLGAGEDAGATFLVQTDLEEVRAHAPDGTLRWARRSDALGNAVWEGRTALADRSGHVVGVDVTNGEVWRTKVIDLLPADPVVADGEVVVATRAGELVRLSLADGREVGRIEASEGMVPLPFTVVEGIVYVPICTGVRALDLGTGEEIWATGLDPPERACADVPVVARAPDVEVLVSATNRLFGLVPSAP